jgi:transcriptional regulator with XRE-family HTH domain
MAVVTACYDAAPAVRDPADILPTGAEAVLLLCAVITNSDFEAYWKFHVQQKHQRTHKQPLPAPIRPGGLTNIQKVTQRKTHPLGGARGWRRETLGMLIRLARQKAGLTQDDLARMAGMSVRALRDLEQGKTIPRPASRRRLAKVLGLPEASLSSGDGLRAGTAPQPDGQRLRSSVNVLGPIVVIVDGVRRSPGSVNRRSILGLLTLRCGSPVSVDELVDLLWTEPPRTCRNLVHDIAAIRRMLLSPGRTPSPIAIRRFGGGYALESPPAAVDLHRFDALVGDAAQALAAGSTAEALNGTTRPWTCGAGGSWRMPIRCTSIRTPLPHRSGG